MARVMVNDELVEQLRKKYPELERLNATDIADWAMRKMLHYRICPPKEEV